MAASREEVFERVKEVLTEQLGVEESAINEEASFQEDLDADSLDLVELIMESRINPGSRLPTKTPTRFRPSARPSTTSRRTSSAPAGDLAPLRELIDGLPDARAGQVYTTPPGRTSARLLRAAQFLGDSVPELAIAREPTTATPIPRGTAREDPLARRLACELRRGVTPARTRQRARGARRRDPPTS